MSLLNFQSSLSLSSSSSHKRKRSFLLLRGRQYSSTKVYSLLLLLLVCLLGSPLLPSEDTTTTSNSNYGVMRTFKNLVPVLVYQVHALAAGGIKTRSFVFSPKQAQEKPKLVLISGCPGTGKSVSRQTVATVAK